MEIHRKEGGLTIDWIAMKTPVLRPALQANQSCCVASTSAGTEEEDQIVSIERPS